MKTPRATKRLCLGRFSEFFSRCAPLPAPWDSISSYIFFPSATASLWHSAVLAYICIVYIMFNGALRMASTVYKVPSSRDMEILRSLFEKQA